MRVFGDEILGGGSKVVGVEGGGGWGDWMGFVGGRQVDIFGISEGVFVLMGLIGKF